MINKLNWYFEIFWEVVSAPILFYTILEKESWKEKALNFLVISSWILSFFITVTVFIIQIYPIGKTLFEGVTGLKFLLVAPVVLAVALMFFMIVFMILGGFALFFWYIAFYVLGLLLHLISKRLGGEGDLSNMLQAVFYASAVLLFFIIPLFFAVLVDRGVLSYDMFRVGYNLVYFLTCLFIYGLLSITLRKVGGHSKLKSFLIALVPFIILILFGIGFDLKGLEKIRPILGV